MSHVYVLLAICVIFAARKNTRAVSLRFIFFIYPIAQRAVDENAEIFSIKNQSVNWMINFSVA